MRWYVAPFVAVISLALLVAAPVPKKSKRLGGVYGDVTDAKAGHSFEMSRGNVLTVTVPTTVKPIEVEKTYLVPPIIKKKIKGDFVLTTRVRLGLPEVVGAADKRGGHATAFAGVSVFVDGDRQDGLPAAAIGVCYDGISRWERHHRAEVRTPQRVRVDSVVVLKRKRDDAIHLRFSRRGERCTQEWSDDGEKWIEFLGWSLPESSNELTIGPSVYGSLDREFTATFDEYDIQPLKEEKK